MDVFGQYLIVLVNALLCLIDLVNGLTCIFELASAISRHKCRVYLWRISCHYNEQCWNVLNKILDFHISFFWSILSNSGAYWKKWVLQSIILSFFRVFICCLHRRDREKYVRRTERKKTTFCFKLMNPIKRHKDRKKEREKTRRDE